MYVGVCGCMGCCVVYFWTNKCLFGFSSVFHRESSHRGRFHVRGVGHHQLKPKKPYHPEKRESERSEEVERERER